MRPGFDTWRILASLTACVLLCAELGCSSAIVRHQSPDETELPDDGPRLVGDIAVAVGVEPIKLESVGLVTRLDGTGSDPAPSANRAALITEMRKKGVRNPHQVLASPDTSLVLVRGFLRPGIQEDETFDLEIQLPKDSETSSLRGGWLMLTEMRPFQSTSAGVLSGHAMAFAEGPLLVNPLATDKNDPAALKRAYVPGGGRSFKDRTFGLAIIEDASVPMSQRIGDAINRRFHVYGSGGIKKGVATPKEDDFIQLAVHPRYKDNLDRFIQVIRSLPLHENMEQRPRRVESLRRQLLDPITSLKASLQLEAMGKDGIEALKAGLASDSEEVRFYCAEALAYLDVPEAAEALALAAREEPAFRVYALSALSAMDDPLAHDELVSLLKEPSAETRYGAFRSLWAMREDDPVIAGESLGRECSLHMLNVDGPTMIHVTRSYRPEVVLFGSNIPVRTPVALEAGKDIVIRETADGELAVSNFQPNAETPRVEVPARVDAMVRAIHQVGGRYPDIIQALFEAKQLNAIDCRLEIDALPQPGRRYHREDDGSSILEDELIETVSAEGELSPSTADGPQHEGDTSDSAEKAMDENIESLDIDDEGPASRPRHSERLHSPAPGLFGKG